MENAGKTEANLFQNDGVDRQLALVAANRKKSPAKSRM
jgi:hypothetical protein